jgi:3-deoxy-D-manno-octulosonate 8-phosphate phosphatase (KDO 8-P phosphatase)
MNSLEKFRDIKNFVFDVDGVLADNQMHILDDGNVARRFNAKDAYALSEALKAGYRIIVITRARHKGLINRLEYLGIKEVYANNYNKLATLEDLVSHHQLDLGETLYMGDDIPDYDAMRKVHFPTCPTDSAKEIISIAQYVSPFKGGHGCVRDVIEKTMQMQGKWRTFNI